MIEKIYRYDPLSAATLYIKMATNCNGRILASATGFIYEHKNELFFITNAHNVTGVNHQTNKGIADHAAYPDTILTRVNTPLRR